MAEGKCSTLLKEAGLEAAVREMSQVPENQDLHAILPDICRSRYKVTDLDEAIAPLLKQPPRDPPQFRPFGEDELRAFALPAGPQVSSLPLNPASNEEEERLALALKKQKKR